MWPEKLPRRHKAHKCPHQKNKNKDKYKNALKKPDFTGDSGSCTLERKRV